VEGLFLGATVVGLQDAVERADEEAEHCDRAECEACYRAVSASQQDGWAFLCVFIL
jgi:hypothetical protein